MHRTSATTTASFLLLLPALLVSGCISAPDVKDAGDKVDSAAGKIERGTENLKEMAELMREAFPLLDPLKIGEFLKIIGAKDTTIEAQRKALDELRSDISRINSGAMAQSFRVVASYNSPTTSNKVDCTFKLFKIAEGPDGKQAAVYIRDLGSVSGHSAGIDVTLQGVDLGPGEYVVQKGYTQISAGVRGREDNKGTFSFSIMKNMVQSGAPEWESVFSDSVSFQGDVDGTASALLMKEVPISVRSRVQ